MYNRLYVGLKTLSFVRVSCVTDHNDSYSAQVSVPKDQEASDGYAQLATVTARHSSCAGQLEMGLESGIAHLM